MAMAVHRQTRRSLLHQMRVLIDVCVQDLPDRLLTVSKSSGRPVLVSGLHRREKLDPGVRMFESLPRGALGWNVLIVSAAVRS